LEREIVGKETTESDFTKWESEDRLPMELNEENLLEFGKVQMSLSNFFGVEKLPGLEMRKESQSEREMWGKKMERGMEVSVKSAE
jgi:hypothetical protein